MRLALSFVFCASAAAAEPLTVYVPEYFGTEWGPTPAIKAAFEETCGCGEVEFVAAEVLTRLRLEGGRTAADVVMGLNTDVAAQARELGIFAPHGLDTRDMSLPIEWTDEVFFPFNWGYTAFVYDTDVVSDPPESFAELLQAEDLRIVIQDPRSSISGLALAYWVNAVFGDGAADAWVALEPNILTVTKGWSESYGLFTSGEADMVMSYTTSPAYHISEEGDDTKVAAIFQEGHYFMAELVAKVADTDQPELADAFLEFVLSPAFQEIIPEGNWSYPAKLPKDDWPEVFRNLPEPEKALFYTEEEAAALRDEVIETWRSALTR